MNTPVPTRRRQQTRQRLLDAALEVFADEGFGRSTVEQVCEHAGFTRGAFYSNFSSLDELFLAMWEQRSGQMLADIESVLGELPEVTSVREAVAQVLGAVPVDDAWFRITSEFTAHALRTPGLRRVMVAREDAIRATLLPILERMLATVGRRITDPESLGQALVAVHDGTSAQVLLEPDDDAASERRTALFTLLVEHHTKEITP